MDPEPPEALCLFDRDRAAHPWQRAFQELRTDPDLDLGTRWVAANWRLDHRVCEEREVSDLLASGHFGRIESANDWREARRSYFKGEICRPSQPAAGSRVSAYARPMNGNNRIKEPLADFDRLVHVASLNSLLYRLLDGGAGARTGDVELAIASLLGRLWPFNRPTSDDSPDFVQAVGDLVREISGRGEDAVRRLAGLLVDALGDSEPPWWASFAEEIQDLLDGSDPARFCSALGLGHRKDGEWLLIWNYSVADAGPLYRPTVLEANDSAYHHPSPPLYPFGITMPLAPDLPACREVLHRPLRGAVAVENCTSRLVRLESFAALGDPRRLGQLRSRHREQLKREFPGEKLDSWFERHPEPVEVP